MSDPVVVLATFHPIDGQEDALLSTLSTMVTHTREEPGNEVYDLYSSDDDGLAYHLFERYRDTDALDAHRATDHYVAYRAKLPDLLRSPVEVTVLAEVEVAH